jgi:hypothetical protein
MKSRRNVLSLITFFALPVLLFQFQNCAPAGGGPVSENSSDVRLIEDLNKAQLQFVSPEIDVRDDVASADLSGLCNRDHNGASLRWAIWASSESSLPLMSGLSLCRSGEFSISLKQLEQMVCGIKHLVVVEGDWGGSTFSHVLRRCQPLASREIAAPEDSPLGTTCALEYTPDAEAAAACSQVCYRANKVVYSKSVGREQCADLVASLTGPNSVH